MVGGIGGPPGGSPPGPKNVGGPSGPTAPATPATGGPKGASFGEVVSAQHAEGASATSPFEQLRSGSIDLAKYVDLKVQEATGHLDGVLPPGELERIRDELRDVIENDPDVAALAKGAEIGS